MTFAAAGSEIEAFSTATFSLTPNGVGNLIVLEVLNNGNTGTNTAISSSNVTWTQAVAPFTFSTNTATSTVWFGTVTSTSAATVTLTFTGTVGSTYAVGQEFSSTAGSWALDTSGNVDGTGTDDCPSLTPAGSGELYFCYLYFSGSASAGSTSGYTFNVDSHENGLCFNPACTSAAQAPVWGGDGTGEFGTAVLVKETGVTPPPESAYVAFMASM